MKILDEQHCEFIRGLNELHAAMMKGQAQSVAATLLSKMVETARKHFSSEEELMTSTKYPGLAEHQGKHRELFAKVEDFSSRHKQGDKTMYLELLKFMRDWLNDHMLKVDKLYTEWLNGHGIH